MGIEERRAILQALPPIHQEESEAVGMGRDICVFASFTGREVLRRFGIMAKPVSVRALAVNKIHWEDVDGEWEKIINPAGHPEVPDGWTVGVGFGKPKKGRWPGHLILTARNPDVFIDLTIDQAARPEKGIPLKPFVNTVPRDLLREFETGQGVLVAVDDESGARVLYGKIDLSPASGTDWNGGGDAEIRRFRDDFIDRVERRVREEITDG